MTMRVTLLVVVAFASLLGGAGLISQSSTAAASIDRIDDFLSAREKEGMNGVILLRMKDDVIFQKAYGDRDRELQQPLTVAHGFDIGSLVKPITAAAILKLHEAGRLSVTETLAQHFSDVPPDKRGITILDVLTHRAGFPDTFGGDYDLVTREEMIERLWAAALIASPGQEEHYSNAGYSLLAALIEERSGLPFERYVRNAVLAPAGVNDIGYQLAGWRTTDLAVSYTATGIRRGTALDWPWLPDGPSWNLRGNGGMIATTRALSDWFDALWDGRVLSRSSLAVFNEIFVRPSRLTGTSSFGFAGGDDVFNAFHASYIAEDAHLTLFTSDARLKAEDLWVDIRGPFIELAGLSAVR